MYPRPRTLLRALVPAVAVALAPACSRQSPVAPIAAWSDQYTLSQALDASAVARRAFFPLTVGNRWHAVSEDRVVTTPTGGGPPIDEMSIHTDITREMT